MYIFPFKKVHFLLKTKKKILKAAWFGKCNFTINNFIMNFHKGENIAETTMAFVS